MKCVKSFLQKWLVRFVKGIGFKDFQYRGVFDWITHKVAKRVPDKKSQHILGNLAYVCIKDYFFGR